jgi:hypothetical protein
LHLPTPFRIHFASDQSVIIENLLFNADGIECLMFVRVVVFLQRVLCVERSSFERTYLTLSSQEAVPGAQFKTPGINYLWKSEDNGLMRRRCAAVPDYSHLPESESKKLAAVFSGSMNAFWQVEMKLVSALVVAVA